MRRTVPPRRRTSESLTTRQRAILEFIKRIHADRGYPPSVREIGEAVGLQSPSSVHAQLATLAERGYLRKDPDRPRAIVLQVDSSGAPVETLPVRNVPLVGRIAAGSPILATENVEDTIPIPQDFTASGTLFALTVRGDSMVDAGILDGDTVIVRQQQTADDGEIVAALVDGEEATVKTLRRRAGKVLLEPANANYEPIAAGDIAILGKVVTVLRRIR
jgi:repressor LexA